MLLGTAYYPEHRDPARWEYDLDNMAQANLTTIRVGEFAWCRFEPTPGKYDFSWLDKFNELAAKRNLKLLLCPPMRTPPIWLVEQEPEVKLMLEDGVRLEFGSRYSFCINNPYLQERARIVAEKMAEHYAGHPNVEGWHLDNEHGDEPDCHCPVCRKKFQDFCRKQYQTIDKLNKEWGMIFWGLEFQNFEQIPTTFKSKTYHSPSHTLAWRRFRSESTILGAKVQHDAVKKYSNLDMTSNMQCWSFRTNYYDYGKLFEYCGLNYYPPYGDGTRFNSSPLVRTRSYKNGKGFHIHELRNSAHMVPGRPENSPAPNEVERLMMHAIGNGADGLYFFRWRACPFGIEQAHGTLTDYDGRPKKIYSEVAQAGEKIKRLSPLLDDSCVKNSTALLFDFETWWTLNQDCSEWMAYNEFYVETYNTVANAIKKMNADHDAVSRFGDFSKYKNLIITGLTAVDDVLAEKIITFVENGGTLIWHPLCGSRDVNAKVFADRIHPKLKPLFGAELREFATLALGDNGTFSWNNQIWECFAFRELPEATTAKVTGKFTDSWYNGYPAVMSNDYGKGKVLTLNVFGEERFYQELLRQYGVKPILEDVNPDLELAQRVTSDGKRIVFIMNTRYHPLKVKLGFESEDIYNEEKLGEEFEIPANGTRIILL